MTTFQSIGDLASSVVSNAREKHMNRSVYQEMKKILGLMDRVKSKPPSEQVALIRAHVAATAQDVSTQPPT